MLETQCTQQLDLFEVGRQRVLVDFEGGQLVSDAGLLPLRQLDRELGILAEAARRLPDPRSQLFVTHTAEQILTQQVYQILAGYPDGNDAQLLRDDPLFKTLVGVTPSDADRALASGSTVNRFLHAYTRREAEKPREERDVLFEQRAAQLARIRRLNEFLVDVFVRTRRRPPAHVIIDLDPTDDPAHGQQQLTFWHGYYEQNQYFPLLVFEGESRLPLGAWLRPGKVHAACGAVDVVREIVARLRAHWPDVTIFVRGDHGVASPEMYEYCESHGLLYAFGYASNAVLKRRVADLAWHAEMLWEFYREPRQHFTVFEDYQADSWSRPRRIIAKVEITATGGLNTRYVVTNLSGDPRGLYHGFYVQRGDVPERPIGELKNGLALDRLSSPRFLANAQKLLTHVLAYLLWALFREAQAEAPSGAEACGAVLPCPAAGKPPDPRSGPAEEQPDPAPAAAAELARLEVGTARVRLFKVAARVHSTHRRVWFHLSSTWPGRRLFVAACAAVTRFTAQLHQLWHAAGLCAATDGGASRDYRPIGFAPLPLK